MSDEMSTYEGNLRERVDNAVSRSLDDVLTEIEVMYSCEFSEDERFRWSGQLIADLMPVLTTGGYQR